MFRRMWTASLLSNLGQLIQGVGATWAMAEMKAGADLIALAQTALMAPVMLFALGAGAIADTSDRRKVGLAALSVALAGSASLTAAA
ncbi:hypothetical protein CVO77_13005 [Sphingopyxis lindanitolerans]|uniref:MFS transporter n=1 Tax=Sphingopyxis lindanitolerans TaxID=2054227 RepID=A0A2S8B101_9SPHN|nr:hypothetical protein CVO77_13005 [Sphingopyxis lindanitolerans]